MIKNIFVLAMILALSAGCSSTRQPSELGQLQIKVAQLDRKVKEKDQEIADLRYDIQRLDAEMAEMNGESSAVEEYVEPKASSTTPTAAAKPAKNNKIIRINASVQEVQAALHSAGYYDGAIDGNLGHKSKSAIVDFQKEHDLYPDGIIGKKTWSELKNYLE